MSLELPDLYEGILTTRAIRSYTDQPVTDEEIVACLRAAQQGPSGGNTQPWQYLVVTDGATKAAVAEIYRAAHARWEAAQLAAMPPFRGAEQEASFHRGLDAARRLARHLDRASALVLFLAPRISIAPRDEHGEVEIGPLAASVYPAVQNLMLAARAHGIGTVLTTVWWSRQDDLRRLLGIPERFDIMALVPMGRPAGSFGVAPRKPVEAVTHWDRFGERRALEVQDEGRGEMTR
jgi:nitroreductase